MYRLLLTFLFTLFLAMAVSFSRWSRGREWWGDYQWPVLPVSMAVMAWIGVIATAVAMVRLDRRRRIDPAAFPKSDVLRPGLIGAHVCAWVVIYYSTIAAIIEFRRPYWSDDAAYQTVTAVFGWVVVFATWRLLRNLKHGKITFASHADEVARVSVCLGQLLCLGWIMLMTWASLAMEFGSRQSIVPEPFVLKILGVVIVGLVLSSPAIVGLILLWWFQRRAGRPKRERQGFEVLPVQEPEGPDIGFTVPPRREDEP